MDFFDFFGGVIVVPWLSMINPYVFQTLGEIYTFLIKAKLYIIPAGKV